MSDVPPGKWSIEEHPAIGLHDPYLRKRAATQSSDPSSPPSKRGRIHETPIAVEVCCGAAGLSTALQEAGFCAKPVDWHGNRHRPSIPFLRIDLCSEEGQRRLWELLRSGNVAYVHCAPPCGTFSKARNIPIPEWQLAQGVPNVRPLRDAQFPEGLPASRITMTATERIKVDKGNQIARLCAQILEFCLAQGITASVEKPLWFFHLGHASIQKPDPQVRSGRLSRLYARRGPRQAHHTLVQR